MSPDQMAFAQLAQQQMALNQQQAHARYSGYSTVVGMSSCMGQPPPAAAWSETPKPKEKSMFSEIARDVKSFVLEHRSILYFLAIALIVDHVLFKDAFRHRLQAIVDKIITKVEDKVSA